MHATVADMSENKCFATCPSRLIRLPNYLNRYKHAIMTDKEKPLEWIASSYKDLMALSPDVRRRFGYALALAQMGDQDDAAKVLKGFGGAACWRSSKTMRVARIGRSIR